jgi:hypothetical protein
MLKRLLRRLLIAVACVIALVVLFYAEENWRGKHAWEKYRREREAKGDSFEWSAIVPPPVPDDQNFAATPLFAELFPKRPEHPRLETVKLPDCPKANGNWREDRIENLSAWQECFTNADLLQALSKYEPVLREVAEAMRRPYARFPVHYEDNYAALLPHLTHLRNLAKTYRLHALAELAAGKTDTALADVRMCLRLADTIRDEPMLITFLVRVAILDLAIQPVWEGLISHRWSEGQLATLQSTFERTDQFEPFVKSLRGERLLSYHQIRMVRENRDQIADVFSRDGKTNTLSRVFAHAVPSGWFYQNELRMDRFYTEGLLPAIDPDLQRIYPKVAAAADRRVKTMRDTPYSIMCKIFAPAVVRHSRKAALSQAGVNQAAVACTLERYRLAHGEFPEKLDVLVPQFLSKIPHDVIDGQPLRYSRTTSNEFILYSIGWNEIDDGGQIAVTSGKWPQQDLDKGDWVWFSQPQPQPSASERK